MYLGFLPYLGLNWLGLTVHIKLYPSHYSSPSDVVPPILSIGHVFKMLQKKASMTSLLAHTVAQSTKRRVLPKNLSHLVIFVIELAFT